MVTGDGVPCSCKMPDMWLAHHGYGYSMIDGQIVVDELRAKHIRTIFSLYLSGMSTLDIAHYMAEQSKAVPELREIKWTYKGVTRILKNEKYTGNSLWQKRITTESFPHRKVKNRGERQQYYAEGTHPPIIDQETFDRTQTLMVKQNRHNAAGCPIDISKIRTLSNGIKCISDLLCRVPVQIHIEGQLDCRRLLGIDYQVALYVMGVA